MEAYAENFPFTTASLLQLAIFVLQSEFSLPHISKGTQFPATAPEYCISKVVCMQKNGFPPYFSGRGDAYGPRREQMYIQD